jgi:hypothetical protein
MAEYVEGSMDTLTAGLNVSTELTVPNGTVVANAEAGREIAATAIAVLAKLTIRIGLS